MQGEQDEQQPADVLHVPELGRVERGVAAGEPRAPERVNAVTVPGEDRVQARLGQRRPLQTGHAERVGRKALAAVLEADEPPVRDAVDPVAEQQHGNERGERRERSAPQPGRVCRHDPARSSGSA